jgi:signal recognition particle receptor subunit beta
LFDITIYGGNPSSKWKNHTAGTADVVCVVDSADETKVEQTRAALSKLYESYEKLQSKSVLLVLTNKQNRLDALSVMEVKNRMRLERWIKGREGYIQGTDAFSNDCVQAGMGWLGT